MRQLKIVFPYNQWRGGFLQSIKDAFDNLGHITYAVPKYTPNFINRAQNKIPFRYINKLGLKQREIEYNNRIIEFIKEIKPDIFFIQSGSGILPSALKQIRNNLKCIVISYIADNPCDSSPIRDKYFGMTLPFYDILLYPETSWLKMLNNLSPKSIKIKFLGGYEPQNFFPITENDIFHEDIEKFSCDISFTGGSYGESAEGSYRSGILGQLDEFNMKVWGDKGWKWRFQFYPSIEKAYQGERLSYADLRKLYTISTININMPSPQIFTSFQPRVFEIAAVKGFQIIDHSDELKEVFNDVCVPTFKSLDELKSKIYYFLSRPDERMRIKEDMYLKVKDYYSWEKQINLLIIEIFKHI